jgi:hypothetical protein
VGGVYVTEEERELPRIERAERELVVKFAKPCHEMGVEDARLALAEQAGAAMTALLSAARDAGGVAGEARVLAELSWRRGFTAWPW